MKLKNRKGSTLALTLIIFAVLMIFATFILNFMVTENKQAMYYQNKTQAYYLARSGAEAVEAAILTMSDDELKLLNNKLDQGVLYLPENSIEQNKFLVNIKRQGSDILITSSSSVGNANNTVSKIMYGEEISNGIEIEYAIFSNDDINMYNSSKIIGDVATNKSIKLNNSAEITGYISLMDGFSLTGKDTDRYINRIKELPSEIKYSLIDFPEIPRNTSKVNYNLSNSDQGIITQSGDYNQLSLSNSSTLCIDSSKNDIILNIRDFSLSNSSKVNIKGSNKVIFFIENMEVSNKTSLMHEDRNGVFSIYHYGKSSIDINNCFKSNFDLYIKEADFNMSNSSTLYANIFSNGNVIMNSNSGEIYGLLYAPNASIKLNNSFTIHGAIVGEKIELLNSAHVLFDNDYIDSSNIGNSHKSLIYKSGYFK